MIPSTMLALLVGAHAPALVSTALNAPIGSTEKTAVRSTTAALDLLAFEASMFSALVIGDALPSALTPVAGRGLVLRSRRGTNDAEHFIFEHPTQPSREASLLLREGRLSGSITHLGNTRSMLTGLRAGVSSVRVEDATKDLPCAHTDEFRAVNQGDGAIAGALCDDGSRVDVLVVYTDAAIVQAGGVTQIGDSILWAISDSNAIYAASGIALQARLVATANVAGYIEDPSSMVNDLYRLRDPADGFMDEIHALRNATGADLVALVRASGGGACGIAWLVGSSVAQESYGFSVTALNCFGGKTFTHELGHNMGCCHAPGDGGGCTSGGVFPYSVGNRFFGLSGTEYRTVMAYAPGTRIGRFSSPLALYDGIATGIADERDNTRSINETRFVFTQFRCSVCRGDFDGDNQVAASDLAIMLGSWGEVQSDLNGDGVSDAADLSILLSAWGPCL